MIRDFLKTRIGISLLIAILFVIGAFIVKITNTPVSQSDVSKKVNLIADASFKKSLADGTYGFEDALNLLSSTSIATGEVEDLNSTNPKAAESNITATDRFARELFTRYAEAKKNGTPIDEVTQNDIAELVLSNNYSDPVKLIKEEDLNTASNMSRFEIKTYGNSVGDILSTERIKGDHELLILERVREAGLNRADIQTLTSILGRYKNMSEKLMALKAPVDAVGAHAAVVNALNLLAGGVEGILTLDTDPVGALTKIKLYENGIDLLSAGAIKFKIYFTSKDITFSSAESGYKLLQ